MSTTGLECFAAHGRTIRRRSRTARRRWRLLRARVLTAATVNHRATAPAADATDRRSIALSARSHTHTRCLFFTCTCEVWSYRTICRDYYFYFPPPPPSLFSCRTDLIDRQPGDAKCLVRVNDKKNHDDVSKNMIETTETIHIRYTVRDALSSKRVHTNRRERPRVWSLFQRRNRVYRGERRVKNSYWANEYVPCVSV